MSLSTVRDPGRSTEGNSTTERRIVDLVTIPSLQPAAVSSGDYDWFDPSAIDDSTDFRLMSFSYARDREAFRENNWNLLDKGNELLWELQNKRQDENSKKRPILFICYSFGAFIAKQALLIAECDPKYHEIFDSLVGILFLGAIHNHQHPKLEKSLRRCVAAEINVSKSDRIFRAWNSSHSMTIFRDTCARFNGLNRKFRIVSLYEVEEASRTWRLRRSSRLVSYGLARPGTPAHGDQMLGSAMNHANLSEVPVRGSPHALTVLEKVREVVQDLVHPVTSTSSTFERLDSAIPEAIGGNSTNAGNQGLEGIPHELDERTKISQLLSAIDLTKPSGRELKLPCRMIRPYQSNENFVGRDETIEEIQKALSPRTGRELSQATCALTGLGGMGKTQTALAYVFKSWDLYQAILWVRANSRAKVLQSFADFAYELGLVDNNVSDQTSSQEEVKRWFENAEVPWLVVFDNADSSDNLELLEDFWPTGKMGSVLITSQDKAVTATFASVGIVLDRLDDNSAIDLLCKGSGQKRTRAEFDALEKIVGRVDRLPLAISQAAFIIRTDQLKFEEFLLLYDNRTLIEKSSPVRGPALRYIHSLSTVWNVSFQGLDDEARALLNLIAFLDTEKVQESMISKGASKSGHPRLAFLKEKRDFVLCRSKLNRSPLIYRNDKLEILWMHGLVQETCHMRMDPDKRQEAFELAYRVLSAIWPVPEMHNRRRNELWAEQQDYVSHVVRLSQHYQSSLTSIAQNINLDRLIPDKMFAELLYNAAWYFIERGLFASAEPLLDIAKNICGTCLEDPDLILADIYGAYGGIDSERNQLDSTLKNFETQHSYLQNAFRKKLLERPNVREALALGGLAQGYAGLNNYYKAEIYFNKCIEAWSDCPGEPTIYQSHLGTCLVFQGKFEAAEEILVKVIKERAMIYGPRDTNSYRTALLYYALGNLRRRQKRFEEAYELEKSCLYMYLATCGPEHHSTGDASYKVAWHLQYKGENEEAVKMYRRALDIYNHDTPELYNTEIARTKYMLGTTYQDLGDNEKGETLLAEAEDLRRSIMGKDWIVAEGEESYDSLVNFWSR